jgi:small subunit ribosomal protein S1
LVTNSMQDEGFNWTDHLDSYTYDRPERGQMLEGVILTVEEDEVLVDVGLKRDGVVPRRDLDRLPAETRKGLKAGMVVSVVVMHPWDDQGELIISINKGLEQNDWKRASQLLESGEITEATVTGSNKGGILVAFGRICGFVPRSHLISIPRGFTGERFLQAKQDLLGQTLKLKVIEIDRDRNRLVFSEREAQADIRRAALNKFSVGQKLTGRVVGIMPYGVFVDIGGIDGLVHVSKLARHYVKSPGDVVALDDEIEVMVEEIDVEHERISLNRKALLSDPWDTIDEQLQVGEVVAATITGLTDFGAFAILASGLEGLIHKSEMTTLPPDKPLQQGDEVLVQVQHIDTHKRQINLSFDAANEAGEPADKEPEGEEPAEET